jgi:putative ABC transport system permease protein
MAIPATRTEPVGLMTHEILIDHRTAELVETDVGDTIYIGGTISAARANQFTIVGISSSANQFLGTPIVTLLLSELQKVIGKTCTDPTTLITLTTADGSTPQ